MLWRSLFVVFFYDFIVDLVLVRLFACLVSLCSVLIIPVAVPLLVVLREELVFGIGVVYESKRVKVVGNHGVI